MTVTDTRQRLSADAEKLAHIEFLLGLYPATTDDELEQIAYFLNTAPPMDIGLLSANTDAWLTAEQVRRDHPSLFRTPTRTWIAVAVAVLAIALIIASLWDSGLKG